MKLLSLNRVECKILPPKFPAAQRGRGNRPHPPGGISHKPTLCALEQRGEDRPAKGAVQATSASGTSSRGGVQNSRDLLWPQRPGNSRERRPQIACEAVRRVGI